MEEIQRSFLQLDRSQQQDFLYPLIFQEYIYAFTHDRTLSRSFLSENMDSENQYSENKSSLLIVKRLITRMYKHNHFFGSQLEFLFSNHIRGVCIYCGNSIFSTINIFSRREKKKNSQISEFTFNSFNISLFKLCCIRMESGEKWQLGYSTSKFIRKRLDSNFC